MKEEEGGGKNRIEGKEKEDKRVRGESTSREQLEEERGVVNVPVRVCSGKSLG